MNKKNAPQVPRPGLTGDNAELRFAPSAEPASVVGVLRRSGIAVVPGFIRGSVLEGLLNDHGRMIERAGGGNLLGRNNVLACRAGKSCSADYPAIHSVFYAEWARAVVTGYLGSDCAFNETVICTHECEPKPITAPHFDTVQALKLFVYLTDTTARNGAFRYTPGSHIANAAEAARWRDSGGRIVETPNVAYSEEVAQMLPFEGPAGTLLIFDTNGFHAGGTLQPGEERRVIRVQSYPLPRLHAVPRRFSLQWFRDTRWNPLNLLRERPVATRDSTEAASTVRKARA